MFLDTRVLTIPHDERPVFFQPNNLYLFWILLLIILPTDSSIVISMFWNLFKTYIYMRNTSVILILTTEEICWKTLIKQVIQSEQDVKQTI